MLITTGAVALSATATSTQAFAGPDTTVILAAVDSVGTSGVNIRDMERFTAEIKTIFEVYLTQDMSGRWGVDAAEVRKAGVSLARMQQIADGFNARTLPVMDALDSQRAGYVAPLHAVGTGAWGKCVINFVAPGALEGFVGGGVVGWLAKGKYAQVASYLLRVVGPAALKGGGVGLVAGLAAGVAWCSTPWAS